MSKEFTTICLTLEVKEQLDKAKVEFGEKIPIECIKSYEKLLALAFDPEIRKAWGPTFFEAWLERQKAKVNG